MGDMPFLSTAQVPPRFLTATYLLGRIPFRVSRSHPSVLWTLYVPPHAYNPDPSLKADENPVFQLPRLPLVVYIHGTGREAQTCRDSLTGFADEHHVAVLAPLFPAAIDGQRDLDSYKLLRSKTLSSDLVLLDILEEVKAIWPGIATEKIFLLGFSGGAQFALRFTYIHPERLQVVSIGAPGQVTHINDQNWPDGLGDVENVFGTGTKPDIEKIKSIQAIQLVVGSEDNAIHGGLEFWEWLRHKGTMSLDDDNPHTPKNPTTVREGRLDTLTKLRDAWAEHGIPARFDIVPGAAHEKLRVTPTMLEFLQPYLHVSGNAGEGE